MNIHKLKQLKKETSKNLKNTHPKNRRKKDELESKIIKLKSQINELKKKRKPKKNGR